MGVIVLMCESAYSGTPALGPQSCARPHFPQDSLFQEGCSWPDWPLEAWLPCLPPSPEGRRAGLGGISPVSGGKDRLSVPSSASCLLAKPASKSAVSLKTWVSQADPLAHIPGACPRRWLQSVRWSSPPLHIVQPQPASNPRAIDDDGCAL